MKTCRKLLSLLLVAIMIFGLMSTLIGCKKSEPIDNETTRLILSTAELDGVFNPFYSSSGADNGIIGMTQIGMLSSDREGKVAFGENESCVVLDYEEVTAPDKSTTTYRFVLKNDLKFSNGSALTMRDVLFNLYVYLDPAYYGSSTIYSTDIVGLKEYRTQSTSEDKQDQFNESFALLADLRISRLIEAVQYIRDDLYDHVSFTDAQMIAELEAFAAESGGDYATLVEDYNLTKKYFKEELDKDYTYSKGTYEDISFTDKNNNKVTLVNDTEAFLYNQGLITWDEEECKFIYSLGEEEGRAMNEEQVKAAVYNNYVPNRLDFVLTYRSTAMELYTYFSLLEKQKYFDNLDDEDKITSVSGIKYANKDTAVQVNGKTYEKPQLDANGAVISGNEVLEITINEVDPKAIWNFGFTVAPMYYYSNAEQIAKFDYVSNFGVEFGSVEFQDDVIKNHEKIGVPVGAGAYKATTRLGEADKVTASTFKSDNVVYFERNDYFEFPVTIKYINFKVVPTNLMLESLFAGEVHMVEPACKQENINEIADNKDDGFASTPVLTNGYGYIGINAEKIPSIKVRQAIMHAINTQLAVDYYFGYSMPIHRPMTKASWAYPSEVDALGQYYAYDATGVTSETLVQSAGFVKNANGVYYDPNDTNKHTCKYTFTIAGDTIDHPAYDSLKKAAEILNAHGFDIEVKTDINALKKLNSGDLTVWAAAWGAGVDPDMYQVYHMDSTAASTANWGYRAIKRNTSGVYDEELKIVEDLSEIIDNARETTDVEDRKTYYKQALDEVMKLAVELPTYQRNDLYAYNTNVIDVNTLTPADELSPYNGPMSRLWEVSLNESGEGTGNSNSGILFIIIISVVVVGGGAGAAVFFVLKKKKAANVGANGMYEFEDDEVVADNTAEPDAPTDDSPTDDSSDKAEE